MSEKTALTIDERWCLTGSGYEDGAYDLVRKHLAGVEKTVCKVAEGYTEDRTPEGPLIVTCDDIRKAIQEYEF